MCAEGDMSLVSVFLAVLGERVARQASAVAHALAPSLPVGPDLQHLIC